MPKMKTPNYIEVVLCALCHKLIDYDLGDVNSEKDIKDSFIRGIKFGLCEKCEEILNGQIIQRTNIELANGRKL